MKKHLRIKSLLFSLFCFLGTFSFGQINWVGNMFPTSGSTTEVALGSPLLVYIQVYKAGTTEPPGQGAGIACEIYYGEVLFFGGAWQNIFTQGMVYNVDIGNNDEYFGGLTPLNAGLYEFTCRCTDDGGTTWEWADLPSGNGQLEVTLPLPVELTSFEAKPFEDYIQLDWTTASERNNEFFKIEKSTDGISFYEIAQVEGAGTSSNLNEYRVIDENPKEGVNYYRLLQIDYDGESDFSSTISVEYKGPSQVNIFPNPAHEKITLANNLEGRLVEIVIFNTNGQLVYYSENELNGQTELDVSALVSGVYFLQIKEKTGQTHFANYFIKN